MLLENETRAVLLNLLSTGLLRVRAAAWDGLNEKCALEADHIHNLPALALDIKLATLKYYSDIERPAFIKRANDTASFLADWDRLEKLLTQTN